MNNSNPQPFTIRLDVKFQPLTLIDIPALAATVGEEWFNQTLCLVNDCVVRMGVLHGEFHWHKHDAEDEFFYVVSGKLLVDWEGRSVNLKPGQGIVIPRGVVHRTRAPVRTVVLMIEGAGVKPAGD